MTKVWPATRALFLLLLGGALASPAVAQDNSGGVLEEVLVTAQKREQNLQDVPASVATLSDEKLDILKSAGLDVRFLSARVPSLYVESSFGRTFPRFYIRGLGNTDFDLNGSQPVSLVYDGVVLENPVLKGFPVFDLDRIEILRGPQGSLFGRNTPAGIVKFESAKPGNEKTGYARVSTGSLESFEFEGAAGGALQEDRLAIRASALYQHRGDWVDNEFTGQGNALGGYDELAGRFQVLARPNDDLSILLNVHGRDLDGTARLFRANLVASGTDEIVDNFDRDRIAVDAVNKQTVQAAGGVLRIDYDYENVTLTSVTGYESAELFSRGDIDGGFGDAFAQPSGPLIDIPFNAETADAVPDLRQLTQEVRLQSRGGEKLNWQAGVFYFEEDLKIESTNYNTTAGGVINGFAAQSQRAETLGVFGSIDYDVNDSFEVTAGARFSTDDKTLTAERTISPLSFLGVGPLAPITRSVNASVLSWDLAGNYRVNDNVNVYGRVARSFRAPSLQGRVLFGDTVSVADTETILSWEGGIKADLLDQRARANVSVFYYTLDDAQLTAVGGAQNFNTLVNADKVNGAGIEVDVEFLVTEHLLTTFGVSYNDTEIDDPNLGIVPGAAAGLTVLDPIIDAAAGVVSIDGNPLPNAPEVIANFTLRYAWPVKNNGEFYVYTDWAYRSEVNFLLYESVEFAEDNLLEGGFRAGYLHDGGRYEFAVYGRNITDDESRTGAIDFNNLTGFVNEEPFYGVEIRSRF